MNEAIAWKPPRSAMSNNFGGLLDKLAEKYGVSELNQASFQVFMDESCDGVVLLAEEPDVAAESWDMAVIFPELLAAIGIRRGALLRPESARFFQARFGIGRLPALLFLRDGGFIGVIEGLRDWSEFVAECAAMLKKPISRAPTTGILVTAASSSCH
jgi:hydrogenase-1 operon protein HyaE